MKRTQKPSPADIALTRTAAQYGQTLALRIREGVKLLRMKAKQ